MRVVILRGRVSIWPFLLGGVFICLIKGCSEDSMYLFFSFFFRYIILVHEVLWPFIDIHCIFLLIYIDVCFSFTYPFMCCLLSFFIHMFLIYLYAIYYFCFTQRCLDEFCLKCFRNTGCQSLFAINSLLAKFFKSLC